MNRLKAKIDQFKFHYNVAQSRKKELDNVPKSSNRLKSLKFSHKKTLSLLNDIEQFGITDIIRISGRFTNKDTGEVLRLDGLYSGITEEEAKTAMEFNITKGGTIPFDIVWIKTDISKGGIYNLSTPVDKNIDINKQKELKEDVKEKPKRRKKAGASGKRGIMEEGA